MIYINPPSRRVVALSTSISSSNWSLDQLVIQKEARPPQFLHDECTGISDGDSNTCGRQALSALSGVAASASLLPWGHAFTGMHWPILLWLRIKPALDPFSLVPLDGQRRLTSLVSVFGDGLPVIQRGRRISRNRGRYVTMHAQRIAAEGSIWDHMYDEAPESVHGELA